MINECSKNSFVVAVNYSKYGQIDRLHHISQDYAISILLEVAKSKTKLNIKLKVLISSKFVILYLHQ